MAQDGGNGKEGGWRSGGSALPYVAGGGARAPGVRCADMRLATYDMRAGSFLSTGVDGIDHVEPVDHVDETGMAAPRAGTPAPPVPVSSKN